MTNDDVVEFVNNLRRTEQFGDYQTDGEPSRTRQQDEYLSIQT